MKNLIFIVIAACLITGCSSPREQRDESPRPIGTIKDVTLISTGDYNNYYVTKIVAEGATIILEDGYTERAYVPVNSQGYLIDKQMSEGAGPYKTFFYYGGADKAYYVRAAQSYAKIEPTAVSSPTPADEKMLRLQERPMRVKCKFTLNGRRKQTVNGDCEFIN